jgi:hypothetical protein
MIAAVSTTVFVLFSASSASADANTIPSDGSLEVVIRIGREWSHEKKIGIAKLTLRPQFALWLEREDGTYAGEVFVTDKSGKLSWGKVRRPEALPVWSHARAALAEDGLSIPAKKNRLSDAVTGATPKPKGKGSELHLNLNFPSGLEKGAYRILLELNNSFDYNEAYAENLNAGDPRSNGVNGQPSVVYAARLELGGASSVRGATEAEPVRLNFIGTGHPAGMDGLIRPGKEGLTSALEIVESIEVRVVRGGAV